MRDLIIKQKGNVFRFRFLKWDTIFFGINSYNLDIDILRTINSKESLRGDISDCFPKHSFITAKIPSYLKQEVVELFARIGFGHITTALLLYIVKNNHHKVPCSKETADVEIIKTDSNKNFPYSELGRSFSFTRFHRDSHISSLKADTLWIEYLKNFTSGPSNHIFLAKLGRKIVGVILLKETKKKSKSVAEITFISVIKKYRNNRIGSKLIQEVIRWGLGHNDMLLVGTQADNINALNFYIRNGFLLKEASQVMHRWS